MKKIYTVVGYSDIVSVKGSWRCLSCIGEPFYSTHVGQSVEKVFVDISDDIMIGDKISLIRVGKSVAYCDFIERSSK